MSRLLDYSFTPDPNPIRASPKGGNANEVTLTVLVTAPSAGVDLEKVEITIPVGKSGGPYLSSDPDALKPTYDTKATPWTIDDGGGVVSITPKSGDSAQLDGTILFTLPGIKVDDTPEGGNVKITIQESYAGGGSATDDSTYSLTKQPAGFVVADFHAKPAVLDDIDLPVCLYWAVESAGETLGYQLRSDTGWKPPKSSYDADDGTNGVETAPFDETTTFTLDVVDQGVVQGSVPLTVRVEATKIVGGYTEPVGSSGRIVNMHWATEYAARCSLELDGVTVEGSVPIDTYHQPYPLAIAAAKGPHQPSVTAYAVTSGAKPSMEFVVHVDDPVAFEVASAPNGVAITPDNSLALVPSWVQSGTYPAILSVVDLARRPLEPQTIQVGEGAFPKVVVTRDRRPGAAPDAALALVKGHAAVTPIDIAHRKAETSINLPRQVQDVAVAPDGSVALVIHPLGGGATIIDLPTLKPTLQVELGSYPAFCAISPKSKVGLVADVEDHDVSVVTLSTGEVEAAKIPLPGVPTAIAIAPDGAHALVVTIRGEAGGTLTWIDIPKRKQDEATIALPAFSLSLAISRDGALALFTQALENALGLVDLVRRRLIRTTIPLPDSPSGVAIAGDGSVIAVASTKSQNVVLL